MCTRSRGKRRHMQRSRAHHATNRHAIVRFRWCTCTRAYYARERERERERESRHTRTSIHFSRSHGHTICRFLCATRIHAFSLVLSLTQPVGLSLSRTRSLARTYYLSDASLALEADRRPKATTLSCGRTLIVEREVKCGAPLPGVLVVDAKPTV